MLEHLNALAICECKDVFVFEHFYKRSKSKYERALYVSAIQSTDDKSLDHMFSSLTDYYVSNYDDFEELSNIINEYHASYIVKALNGLPKKVTTVSNFVEKYLQEINL